MTNAGLDNWKDIGAITRDSVVSIVSDVERKLFDSRVDMSRLCYLLTNEEWQALGVDRPRHEGGLHIVKIGGLTVRRE